MSNIPQARSELLALASELEAEGARDFARRIRGVVRNRMIRVPYARPKTQPKNAAVDAERAQEIRVYARENPRLSNQEIADWFGTNPGRVSEALHYKR